VSKQLDLDTRGRMKSLMRTMLVGLALMGAGCTVFVAKETLYLESAQDRATQEEVRQRLGPPKFTATSLDAEPVWVYHIMQRDYSNQNSWGTPGAWCDEYVLTFDKGGILRRWTHKSEGHGGELMPKYCVTGGFKPTS